MPKVLLYDTTLRDGTQWEGISLSVEDKLKIAAKLDEFRIDYIEGGWPGSNPKDIEFFRRVRRAGAAPRQGRGVRQHAPRRVARRGRLQHSHARRSGDARRRPGRQELGHARHRGAADHARRKPGHDPRLGELPQGPGPRGGLRRRALLRRLTSRPRVRAPDAPRGRRRPAPTCSCCATPTAAACPGRSRRSRAARRGARLAPLGIHTHNDSGERRGQRAGAVRAGATQVQGTINGYGERCGNVDLCVVIPNLVAQDGRTTAWRRELVGRLTELSWYVSEVANVTPDEHQPYVGRSAFAHKGGIHVSAVMREASTYEHIDPALVGNARRVVGLRAGRAQQPALQGAAVQARPGRSARRSGSRSCSA